MIYITGDTHRNFDRIEYFCDSMKTTKDDLMIILGDAGINYYGKRDDRRFKRYIESLPITFMLIRGNHESRPDQSWPTRTKLTDTYSGTFIIEPDYPSILYAQDGRMYSLNTENGWKNAFVIGGAYSVDKYYRLGAYAAGNHSLKWFEDEQLSEEEMITVEHQLDKALELNDNQMSYILTHTCPTSMEPKDMFLPQIDQSTVDKSMEIFLERILKKLEEKNVQYEKWFCGHWHTDRFVPGNFRFVFRDILSL